jgi:hypothetical protein
VRRALAAAAAVGAAALAGCGGGGGSGHHAGRPPQRTNSLSDEVQALMTARGAALTRRDARALAALDASPRLRAADRRRVARLRALPIRPIRYDTYDVSISDPHARIRTVETYRVAGVPGNLFSLRRVYLARRDRRGWRIAGERTGRERQPWEVGRFRLRRSRHFAILAPRAIDVRAAGLPAALERARRTIARLLPDRIARRYLVVVAADASRAHRLASHIAGIESLVAIADSDIREEGAARRPAQVYAQRLVLIWPPYRALGPAGRARILEHELTHLVTAPVTSGLTPSWLVEGLALYVSGDRRVDEAAQLLGTVVLGGAGGSGAAAAHRELSLTSLSAPDAIGRLDGPGQGAAYAYSSAAAFYIADKYGRAALTRLYAVFNADDLPGAAGVAITDAAVRRVLHVSLGRLERNLRAWILARALVAPGSP